MKVVKDLTKNDQGTFLDDLILFENLDETQKDTLFSNGYMIYAQKGEAIFREGDVADCLFIIKSGRIKLTTYDTEGREKIFATFSSGEIIWESVFLEAAFFPFSAIALSEVEICKLFSHDFELALRDGEVAMKLVRMLSKKLHDANQRNLVVSSPDPKIKIARLFLYHLEVGEGGLFKLKLDDIAATLSIRPETASRKLGELLKEDIIGKRGQSSFYIKSYEKLKKISET